MQEAQHAEKMNQNARNQQDAIPTACLQQAANAAEEGGKAEAVHRKEGKNWGRYHGDDLST